jgi:hypothetical protein
VYFGLAAIYIVLSVVFIADVVRSPALNGIGKVAWVAALVFVPIFAWPVYGIWRMRRTRALA